MKKRFLPAVLALTILTEGMAMAACKNKDDEKTETPFDYAALYQTTRTEPYEEKDGNTNRASFGYTQKAEQGYNGWYYESRVGGLSEEMKYDAGSQTWQGNGASIQDGVLKGGENAAAVRRFAVTKTGEFVVYGNFKCERDSSPSASVAVYLGDTLLYGGTLAAGDTAGKYFEAKGTANAGDSLYFCVKGAGSEVFFNPVVTYENAQNSSLYHLAATGKQYGDVFPYYDEEEHKLYMGFLWSDDARLPDAYHNALEISENMLAFADVPEANNYGAWQRYKENYRLHFLFDCNRFIDRSVYPFGVRDNMLYYDEENERYLLIAGCYYRFDSAAQTSDLVIYASDDKYATSWTRAGTVVEAGYSRNLPECPSLMEIGDRWYAFVSVAYNTAHQVGPLQYWTGDAGVDCLDVDWTNKEFSFLDGEDLCAARPTKVGDKVYMWGWIPSTYDTMPWAPWAGYLNLPREVVQHPDGSLGGRLDPALSKLLNYGNIYSLSAGNYEVETGSAEFSERTLHVTGSENRIALGGGYSRNYVTFHADMKESRKVGYVMKQAGKEYQVVVEKENGKTYMKVLSPFDESHRVNSALEIGDADEFDVKIVIDGAFVEFFIGDEYALTAHTAMTGPSYEAYLYADKAAAFENVKINKLIPYQEI